MAKLADSPFQTMSKAEFDRFVPMNGYILFQRAPETEKVGQIILVPKGDEKVRREVTEATVVRIGKPKLNDKGKPIPVDLKAGETVLLSRFAGHDLVIGETYEKYVLAIESEALCVIQRV